MEWILILIKIWLVIAVILLLLYSCLAGDYFTHRRIIYKLYPDPRNDKKENLVWFGVIGVSAFIGLFFFFSGGFDTFIPRHRGRYNEDGDWSGLISTLGFVFAVLFMVLLTKMESLKKEKTSLSCELKEEVKAREGAENRISSIAQWANVNDLKISKEDWKMLFGKPESKQD